MGERRVDEEGYVWEYSNWTGEWKPVRDWMGSHVREGSGGSSWFGASSEDERRRHVEEQGGLCFLTTACTSARGLPDDCEELERMRAFRDEFVSGLPDGGEILREYYEHAPAVVAAAERSPDRDEVYESIYREIRAAIAEMNRGDESVAFDRCMKAYEELKRRFL